MWRDICLSNCEAITGALRLYREWFDRFEYAVAARDEHALNELFARGRRMRERAE